MLETKEIWSFLSGIPIGTVIAWIIVISTIASTLCAGTIKLYKLFIKYKEAQDKDEKQQKIIDSHDDTLKEICKCLEDIKASLEEQKDVNLKQLRHTIVHTCEDSLEKGEISINKLQSLEEMFDEYTDIFHANGYVKTLVMRVRKLPIRGKLEE